MTEPLLSSALYSPPRTDLTGKITSRLIMPLNSDPSRLGRWLHRCLLTDSLTLKASTVPCTTVSGAWNWKTGLRDNSKWINCTARGDVFLPEQPRDTRASRAWQDCDHAPADLQPAPGNSQGHSLGAWLCSSSNWVPVISPGVLPSLSLPADLCLHGVFGGTFLLMTRFLHPRRVTPSGLLESLGGGSSLPWLSEGAGRGWD